MKYLRPEKISIFCNYFSLHSIISNSILCFYNLWVIIFNYMHYLSLFLSITNKWHKNSWQENVNGHVKLTKYNFTESDYLISAILYENNDKNLKSSQMIKYV